jgi:uncharacterized protein YmfQ (DUF2313 family)
MSDPAIAYVWIVHGPSDLCTLARWGEFRWGEPLGACSAQDLECTIRRLKPAHTSVVFSYDL